MKPTELFRMVMCELIRLTDLSEDSILHSNLEECADARSILVHSLSLHLTDMQIATLTGKTRQGVSYIRSGFDTRRSKWSVESNWKAISKYLERNYLRSK